MYSGSNFLLLKYFNKFSILPVPSDLSCYRFVLTTVYIVLFIFNMAPDKPLIPTFLSRMLYFKTAYPMLNKMIKLQTLFMFYFCFHIW